MNLVRLDSNPHRKDDEAPDDHVQSSFAVNEIEDAFPVDDSSRVRVPFPRFGRGPERRPSFAVDVTWLDVKNLIQR
jgi:hypothetical protein